MGQALAITLEPQLHLVIELTDVFVAGEIEELAILRGLAGLPVSLRNDPEMNVIGVTAIGIGLREYMQPVRMQVGHVRAMYAVHMALE